MISTSCVEMRPESSPPETSPSVIAACISPSLLLPKVTIPKKVTRESKVRILVPDGVADGQIISLSASLTAFSLAPSFPLTLTSVSKRDRPAFDHKP